MSGIMAMNSEEVDSRPLTVAEMKLAERLAVFLNQKAGSGAVTASSILEKFRMPPGDGSRLRKIIHYMRIKHMTKGAILSSANGYWISKDPDEIKTCIESHQSHIFARESIVRSLKEDLKKLKK